MQMIINIIFNRENKFANPQDVNYLLKGSFFFHYSIHFKGRFNNMDITKNNSKRNGQKLVRPALMLAMLGLGTVAFASNPTSGQLVIINGVANVVNGGTGSTASSVKIVVNDSTGACSTTA